MKKTVRIGLAVALCVGLVCGYYYYLSHRNPQTQDTTQEEKTEVEKIIAKDFEDNYPRTPREVVKWYNRIITAFYSEEYSDKELEQMAEQARMLMDKELLEGNPKDVYLEDLKADIEDYKIRKKEIIQSSVSDSEDVVYATINGDYCAYVKSYYFSKEASDFSRTYEEYVLREDKNGQWKILTFRLIEGEDNE